MTDHGLTSLDAGAESADDPSMQFEQIYLGCLAHASYFIHSDGEAVVVDPQRDVDGYIQRAEAAGVKIRYIVETHLHADFVSGHRELAEKTGAEIVFGDGSGAAIAHRAARDGDVLRVGTVVLEAIQTPGHTPESVCWLVRDEAATDAPEKLLTGDTLFIGDVGRPDLAGGRGYTAEEMAGLLYDSLHGKILPLADSVEIWPAHGAGSACGKNISKERSSTLGVQRLTNYALRPMAKEAFIAMMTADLPPAPRYFPMDAEINRRGARPLREVAAPALDAEATRAALLGDGALLLDVRGSSDFASGFIPGSVNIGLDGQFASWAGTLLDPETRVVIVAGSAEQAREAVMRLARVGLENVAGWLNGGTEAWTASGGRLEVLQQLQVGDLRERKEELRIIDVRRESEHRGGHLPGAVNVPLAALAAGVPDLGDGKPIAVICAGGYRSSIAASLFRRSGAPVEFNVAGGTAAWVAAGYSVDALP